MTLNRGVVLCHPDGLSGITGPFKVEEGRRGVRVICREEDLPQLLTLKEEEGPEMTRKSTNSRKNRKRFSTEPPAAPLTPRFSL